MIAILAPSIALLLAAGLIAVWSPRWTPARVCAALVAILGMGAAAAAMSELPGTPKRISLEFFRGAHDAEVVGALLHDGEAISLWLMLPSEDRPRYYVAPWSNELAEQLVDAQRDAGEQGQLRMRMPFEPSLDDREPKFYVLPQLAPPSKDMMDPPPYHFERPA